MRVAALLGLLAVAGVSAEVCLDIKKAYQDQGCCGMSPSKSTNVKLTPVLKPGAYNVTQKAVKYYDVNRTELTGMLIYQEMPAGSPKRPGLVLYGGPWGDGGGSAEREYAKVYASKGMVVFLPDYFPEVCGDTNQTTLMICLGKYFGGFLRQTAYAQRIALLAYNTLKQNAMVDATKIGAMGFCFGGAMALHAARAGAAFEVAVSLHGEYPDYHAQAAPTITDSSSKRTAPWATKYFVEMIGYDDPFIPMPARDAWMAELTNATRGTNNTGEVQIWLKSVHAFSIQYSATFLTVLGTNAPGAAIYQKSVAEKCFDKIDFLFEKHGLIKERTSPANPALPMPRKEWQEGA